MATVMAETGDALLEVRVLHPGDAEQAAAGGADRLLVVALDQSAGEPRTRAPEPALVSSVARATPLPVRALLRLPADGVRVDTTTGAGIVRMAGLAQEYVGCGAEGVVFGFLTDQLEIDVELCTVLADQLPCPWTFTRAIDHALDHRRAWRQVAGLPGLDGVLAAGSPLGAGRGHEQLLRALREPGVADLLVASGGLAPEQVPWLLQAGVRAFHLGGAARPDRSWSKAHTDAGLVRSWRLLLDDELARRRVQSAARRH